MKVRTIILFNLIAMCLNANAQAREPSETQQLETRNSIFSLPPFERAVCCIKYYEADLLLRKDLMKFCGMFSAYGKDSLLLAALAYNVGPYRILGCKKKYPKSTLLKKIEAGIRDFKSDYVQFCRWKSKKIPSIERRRYAEWTLLYIR